MLGDQREGRKVRTRQHLPLLAAVWVGAGAVWENTARPADPSTEAPSARWVAVAP